MNQEFGSRCVYNNNVTGVGQNAIELKFASSLDSDCRLGRQLIGNGQINKVALILKE